MMPQTQGSVDQTSTCENSWISDNPIPHYYVPFTQTRRVNKWMPLRLHLSIFNLNIYKNYIKTVRKSSITTSLQTLHVKTSLFQKFYKKVIKAIC